MEELPFVLDWLAGEDTAGLESVTSASAQGEAKIQMEEVAGLVPPGPITSFMDRIRFAAANRLLVRLGYAGATRDIEVYALARSSEGALLLQAIRHQSGETRSYRFDRIASVELLEQSFIPRYAIEITSAGHLPVHQITRASSVTGLRSHTRSSRRSASQTGPTYVYRCGLCQKDFRRKSMDSRLNAHKNKSGYPCSERKGSYVKTTR